jgi:hypothetical protein
MLQLTYKEISGKNMKKSGKSSTGFEVHTL